MSNVTPLALKTAESPYKQAMLDAAENLRMDVEAGKVTGFTIVMVATGNSFATKNVGDITKIELMGLLTRAVYNLQKQMDNETV